MIGIIDTCSLISFTRYYLSLKDETQILAFLKQKFHNGEIIVLNTILQEASRAQKGIALDKMPFLNDKNLVVKDEYLLPNSPKKFSNQIDNNFCHTYKKKVLSDEQYIVQKEEFMKSGDAKLIMYASSINADEAIIITEETGAPNDGKLFKKIPTICDILKLKHMSIAEWLASNGITINWRHPSFIS